MRLQLLVIAKNEAARIGACLDSARAHVDQMIVYDTGSSDGTVAVAEEHGARVHRGVWKDDFAQARNAALDLASADWVLFLDADEEIESGGRELSARSLPAGGGGMIGSVEILSPAGEDPTTVAARSWTPRVLPRGVRYSGRVHEQPVSDFPHVRLGLRVRHSGYMGAALARKGDRNERLLMAELERAPEDGYLWYQLGREYRARERLEQAVLCFTEAIRLTPEAAAWREGLVARTLTALKDVGRLDDAQEFATSEFDRWHGSAQFLFRFGELHLAMASRDLDRALQSHIPLAEWAWKRCLELGDDERSDGVIGCGGRLPAHNLAILYETLGQPETALNYRTIASTSPA